MPLSDQETRSDCPISFALEVFGDRWTLLVLRDLLLRSRSRYRELLASEEGIATNVLADRLRRLEQRELIRKERDALDARQYVYKPTKRALSLVPMLVEMIVWGMENGVSARADRGFVRRFEKDRGRLIADLQAQVRKAGGLE